MAKSKLTKGLCKMSPDLMSVPRYHMDKLDEDLVISDGVTSSNVYDNVQNLHQERLRYGYSWPDLAPEDYLIHIAKEIESRVRLTQHEIFNIGELLINAKKVCQQNSKGFKEWIGENFDFSYETANNFMNVYKYCMGFRKVALQISPSILYQLSSPSFPEELRKYLFENGNLKKITKGALKSIEMKFNEGGWEAVESDIEEISQAQVIFNQIHINFDLIEDIQRRLVVLKNKIEGGRTGEKGSILEDPFVDQKTKAREINRILHDSVESSLEIIRAKHAEAEKLFSEFLRKIHNKLLDD